ncbi:Gp138 family membrane-puncturing spike protein, partial [Bacillus thuringiensis]
MVSAENEDGSMRQLPPAADVPLFQLGGGDFVITLEPKKGDPCLLLVADRCIDVWYELAENAIPGDFR